MRLSNHDGAGFEPRTGGEASRRRSTIVTVSLVVTLNGADRPGVVARVADRARACGASWQQSRVARLAGRFAGVVLLVVPEASLTALERTLRELESDGLHVTVERGEAMSAPARPRLELELVGQDRPGIVHDITAVLARHDVNIEELETAVESASMSGELLFHAHAALALPENIELDALRRDLERIANELMVDLQLEAVAEAKH
jgi:glycine cleavage system regulatory protein